LGYYARSSKTMPKEFQQLGWDELTADQCRRLVRAAVLEDLDRGQDWTTVSLVPSGTTGRAAIVARQAGVIAGLPAIQIVLDEMDRQLRFEPASIQGQKVSDGIIVLPGTTLGDVKGPARSLLTAERLVLNIVGRLSGIATLTRRFVDAVAGMKSRIYDTRKTTPGWRRLEKYAVHQGGGQNHRTGLFDAILIKDNHLALGATAGKTHFSAAEAVRHVRKFIEENFPDGDPRRGMIVEVEVDSLDQLQAVILERPDIVLLDNFGLDQLRRAVELRNSLAEKVELESSGGVTLATVQEIAATGVDRISSGALTHSAASLDVALDWLA
jgi:nicotinate-nucleotide pyrophosphorylase (carboxylating)